LEPNNKSEGKPLQRLLVETHSKAGVRERCASALGQNPVNKNALTLQSFTSGMKSPHTENGHIRLDFTFNTIKDVKKVDWKQQAPWYREITDGFCWLAYCQNTTLSANHLVQANLKCKYGPNARPDLYQNEYQRAMRELDHSISYKCPAYNELVVINRGYDVFQLKKETTNRIFMCPCCRTSKYLKVRNCGFVNCEWSMRGTLRKNKESKIYADGRTYDGKLYTFKECDYQ